LAALITVPSGNSFAWVEIASDVRQMPSHAYDARFLFSFSSMIGLFEYQNW
jgi:hypothetical protein